MDDYLSCRSCNSSFDLDMNLRNGGNEHRLPVSCRKCPYTVCHVCFEDWFNTWHGDVKKKNERERSSKMECPDCLSRDGFDALKPNISPLVCLLLRHADAPAPSRAATIVTPPRSNKHAPAESEEDSKPTAVKKRKTTSASGRKKKDLVLAMTTEERETLRDADPEMWLKDMQTWLEQVNGVSKDNLRMVMNKVRKLVEGTGIMYKQWPPNVRFMERSPVNLSMDFDEMLQKAKDFEEEHGEDKGHGWLMRHQIRKLGHYQRYVVEEKLRKNQEWPLGDTLPPSQETQSDETETEGSRTNNAPQFTIGTEIYQQFIVDSGKAEWYRGEIKGYSRRTGMYRVLYEDNDELELPHEEIVRWVPARQDNS